MGNCDKSERKLFADTWFWRCVSPVASKLKVVSLPVRPVWYCKHPSGGLEYQVETKFKDWTGQETAVDISRPVRRRARDLSHFDVEHPGPGRPGEGKVQAGRVPGLVAHLHVNCSMEN